MVDGGVRPSQIPEVVVSGIFRISLWETRVSMGDRYLLVPPPHGQDGPTRVVRVDPGVGELSGSTSTL